MASQATIDALHTLVERSGIERVHMLAWRDLDDVEAGDAAAGKRSASPSGRSAFASRTCTGAERGACAASSPPAAAITGQDLQICGGASLPR